MKKKNGYECKKKRKKIQGNKYGKKIHIYWGCKNKKIIGWYISSHCHALYNVREILEVSKVYSARYYNQLFTSVHKISKTRKMHPLELASFKFFFSWYKKAFLDKIITCNEKWV